MDARPEEAVHVITHNLARSLRESHQALLLRAESVGTYWQIRMFHPDVLHFVLSPTAVGFMAAKFLSMAAPDAPRVISAPHPGPSAFARWTASLRPDLLLAQASDSEERFRKLGHRVTFFPNGVDTGRFRPVKKAERERLRQRYGIGDGFVILHVGPLKPGRNLGMLRQLNEEGRRVIVVGRPSDPGDASLQASLKRVGIEVWIRHLEAIEDLFRLADCYVFPTHDRTQSVEMPLSVLEAMACNLPVVSTPFGALPRVAEEGDGLWYAASEDKFLDAVRLIQENRMPSRTRDKVLGLSWDVLAHRLAEIYRQAIAQKRAQHRTRKGPLPRQ